MRTEKRELFNVGEIKDGRENFIFSNGFSFGMRAGAQSLIKMLQNDINEKQLRDVDAIKMLIFDTWKSICIDNTNFIVEAPHN